MPRVLPPPAAALPLFLLLLSGCAEHIAVHGPIAHTGAEATARRIAESTAPTIVLDLASAGGEVDAGLEIVAAMEAVRGRTQLVTRVRDFCHSMCVALFLAGDERIAAPGARFLVHGTTDRDGAPVPAAMVPLVAYYLRRGVDPAWVLAHAESGRLLSPDPLALSGEQMAELISR